MKTFEIHYTIDGRPFEEVVCADSIHKARQIIRMRYPDAKITAAFEV